MKKMQQPKNKGISSQQTIVLQDEALQSHIATAAYFRAQERGFQPGQEVDDWLAAEADIKGKRTASWAA